MPTPKHQPTPQTKKIVESLAANGNSHTAIVDIMHRLVGVKITEKTLRKYYSQELKAVFSAHAKVRETLYAMATKGTAAYQASTFFYCKTQIGMKETNVVEHTGEGGGPLQVKVNFVPPKPPPG